MCVKRRLVSMSLILGGVFGGGAILQADAPPSGSTLSPVAEAVQPENAAPDVDDPFFDPVTEHGQRARGFYASGPYVRRRGTEGLIRSIRNADMDAVVIDLKDGQGRITYDTQIPILEAQERRFLGDAAQLVTDLKAAGIYTIARVVCFADPQLPLRHPERAIVHNRRGTPWVSWGTGGTWLDPFNQDNHDMIVELTREAAALGFDEIQLDYIRFPVDRGTDYARYPQETDQTRPQLLLGLLRRIDEAVRIPLGVDVFGLTAFREGDRDGLGQDLEQWIDHVEVYTPMLYLNSMRSWELGHARRAFRLIQIGTSRMRARLGDRPVIRPWLQAFERGSDHWSPEFIAEQIRGARNGHSDGFLFWHPGSNYGMLNRGMRTAARGLSPFPTPEARLEVRAQPSAAAEPEVSEP